MIKEFVERWEANKDKLRAAITAHPDAYSDLVRLVVQHIQGDENAYITLDPERIHVIDDGGYQGTLVFIIAEKGYQPDAYWYVKVSYGSCSGCDTLESIRDYQDGISEAQKDAYMTLALHIVQGLRSMNAEPV